MAEVLKGHDFATSHGNAIYPWDEWSDGQTRRITMGEDFHVQPRVMQGQIKVRGSKAKRKTKTSVQGDSVIFTFQREDESDEDFLVRVSKASPS